MKGKLQMDTSTAQTNERKVPKFCSVDGGRLLPSTKVHGYDAFSGEPLVEERFDCPNETVTGRIGARVVTQHPSWQLVGGTWQVD